MDQFPLLGINNILAFDTGHSQIVFVYPLYSHWFLVYKACQHISIFNPHLKWLCRSIFILFYVGHSCVSTVVVSALWIHYDSEITTVNYLISFSISWIWSGFFSSLLVWLVWYRCHALTLNEWVTQNICYLNNDIIDSALN